MKMRASLRKVHNVITRSRFYKNRLRPYHILFYDSIFPNPLSGFRFEEFFKYLRDIKCSKILVEPIDYPILKQTSDDFEADLKNFREAYPAMGRKVRRISLWNNINGSLLYCVFYNNIFRVMPIINHHKIPFAFTLYPGGGFNLESPTVKENLKEICGSSLFKGVIVTQRIIRSYLVENNICDVNKINYIFGGIVPQNSLNSTRAQYFKYNKQVLDVCFCANKYMPAGLDKGYDIFIEVAKTLVKRDYSVQFHVVGDFDREDIALDPIESKVQFYGKVKFEELQKIFLGVDLILSPNRPNMLGKGSFDGFPLGTVVEAAFNGVIPIVTDELRQNDTFTEDELCITRPSVGAFVDVIEKMINETDFKARSLKTQSKFRKLYSNEVQLKKRIQFLDGIC